MNTARHTARGPLAAALHAVREPLWMAGLISLIANLLMLTPTLYMLQLYERVLVSQNVATWVAVSVVALVSLLAMAWADRRRNRRLIAASVELDRLLAPQAMASAHQAALSGQPQRQAAPLADVAQLRQFLTGPAAGALFDVPWTPVYVAVLWLLHPWLGAAALGFMALQFALALWGHRCSAAAAEPAARAEQAAAGFLQHKFRQAEVVEAMGMARGLWLRWQQQHALQTATAARVQAVSNRVQAMSRFTRYAQQSLALGLGGWLVVRGQLGVGMMIAANVLTTRALAPMDALAGAWRGLDAALVAARRLNALLRDFPPVAPARSVPVFDGAIGLDAASVAVPGTSLPVLHDVHLQLVPGTITVLMGPSGAGKSTLAKVLAGAWPGSGELLRHGGRQLSPAERAALGPWIGYLPQEIELADASVQDNIARLGRPDPQAVLEAARRCGLHAAILRLPKGYDTRLGKAGHPLSGGIRQRIALARAVYGSPRLLILDEPNAHLDDAGEAALAALLHEHRRDGGTALVVTHRRGVVALADRVLVLEAGRIVTDGPRERVLAAHQATAPVAPVSAELRAAAGAPDARAALPADADADAAHDTPAIA